MPTEIKCKSCETVFIISNKTDSEKLEEYCAYCGSKELEFLSVREPRPKLTQAGIRDVFAVGQNVLVRWGIDWRTREILGITVLRHDTDCPHCSMPLLGEPRFWFRELGNVSLEDIMAKEDIDPDKVRLPSNLRVTRIKD